MIFDLDMFYIMIRITRREKEMRMRQNAII